MFAITIIAINFIQKIESCGKKIEFMIYIIIQFYFIEVKNAYNVIKFKTRDI